MINGENMKLSEKLLKKINAQFPQTVTVHNKQTQLRAVRGINDGTHYKWSNGEVGESHIFSYHTMKECMENDIYICQHHAFEGNSGWEIYIKP